MIDFAAIWDDLAIGDEVTVSNGQAEPLGGTDALDHRIWRSHNFTAALGEKLDGTPRAMRFDLPADEAGSVIGFVVREGDGHTFQPAVITPAQARDQRWVAAQAYREGRRNAPLGVWGVFPNRAVVVKMDVESRLTIAGAVQMATLMKSAGLPFSFTFDDEAGVETTIDADQTIALGLGVATFSGICDGKLRAVRIALDTALAAGETAEQIKAIDVTAGYPVNL